MTILDREPMEDAKEPDTTPGLVPLRELHHTIDRTGLRGFAVIALDRQLSFGDGVFYDPLEATDVDPTEDSQIS